MNTPRYSGAIVSFRPDGQASGSSRTIRAAYGLVYENRKLYASMNQRDDLGAHTPGDTVAVIRGQDCDSRVPRAGRLVVRRSPRCSDPRCARRRGGVAVASDSVIAE
jgi:hypothetical protein